MLDEMERCVGGTVLLQASRPFRISPHSIDAVIFSLIEHESLYKTGSYQTCGSCHENVAATQAVPRQIKPGKV